jgi:predicted nucleic-acid-binding protein
VIGLDTNVLLRWLIDESIWPNDAPHQTQAIAQIIQSGETVFVNHVVIAETIWVLTQGMKQPKATVVDIINRLIESANVEVDRRAIVEDALSAFTTAPGQFADHLIAAINQAAHCRTTLTFDVKASRSGRFTRLTTRST